MTLIACKYCRINYNILLIEKYDNFRLIKMRTTGVLNNMYGSRDPTDYKSTTSDDMAITFQNIQILFFGYAFAIVLVLIVFGCEFLYYYYFRTPEKMFT